MLQLFAVFLRLGLTSFGGPVAHLGYFREEFVARRRWLDDEHYADLVALCQALPGPASSQVGLAIGWQRAGVAGALLAWCGFTLPSALLMALAALGVAALPEADWRAGLLHGLKLAALVVVLQAVWQMGRRLCPDRERRSLALLAAALLLWWQHAAVQVAIIGLGAVVGLLVLRARDAAPADRAPAKRGGILVLSLFVALLLLLPLTREWGSLWALADAFYRSGALVFGGGHVVLPLLEAETVQAGWIGREQFLAGYGLAQAVPGPLFTFAAFLGASIAGWAGALLALVAIFLPSFFLVGAVLPYWARWRGYPRVRAALDGINAAVVGLLLAALLGPVREGAITGAGDYPLALVGVLLLVWGCPAWLLVLLSGALGACYPLVAITGS